MIGKREEAEGVRRRQLRAARGICVGGRRMSTSEDRASGAGFPFHSDDVVGPGPVGRVRDGRLNETGRRPKILTY